MKDGVHHFLKITICLFLIFGVSGCGGIPGISGSPGGTGIFGTGGNNPATRPTPGFTEVEVQPATSVTDGSGQKFIRYLALSLGGVDLDEVRLVVRNFDFDDSLSPGMEGPGYSILRLIQNGMIVDQALPILGSVILPEGNYKTLDFRYKILNADEIPPEAKDDPVVTQFLVGHSIVIEGSFLYPVPLLGTVLRVPFRFFSEATDVIRIEEPLGLPLFGQIKHFLFLASKVQLWFDITVVNLLQTLSINVMPILGGVVNGVLILDVNSAVPEIRNLALHIQGNIDEAFRFALSQDNAFDEGDVLEDSFSFVLSP